ncbi:MAG: S9 family peptidase [Clostridium sp.]|nr:S9 family peptidase [Prevotella sp.]MCM1428782.1 S9 family peptidase [Clostridium sp.]
MNKLPLKMSAMLLPGLLIGCNSSGASDDEKIIEKPVVEIKDGMLTPEVLEAFGRIGEFTLSPDGKTIAFTLTYEDIEENKGNSEIYTMNADGSEMKRLTTTAGSESSLQWIDNGERIAFLAKDKESGKPQVFSMKADGGDRICLSSMENGVESFRFSPDGKRVVMSAAIKPFNQDTTVFEGLPKTTGRVVNDLMYKHWDEWVTQIPHPFVANFDGKKISDAKDIMKDEPYECPMRPFGGAESFAWSPDSKQLIYVSRKEVGKDYAFSTNSNLYLYDLASGKTVNLTEENPGYDTAPKFSPDGKSIAWLSMATPKYEADKNRLMVMDMATKKKRDLTANWDRWPEEFTWGPDGKEIYFAGYHNGTEPVFKINVATCAVDTLAAEMWDYSSVVPTAQGKVYAIRHNMLQPNDIVAIEKGKVTPVTDINHDILDKLAQVKVEKRMVPTTDGKEMLTWVILPPNFDPNKKYPALLYCQGGPQQAVSQFWSYRWNFRIMAANGYIVIAPARRGTPGFGYEWNHQISGDYGGQNMKDYLAAVDYMTKEPYVDKEHVGAVGASYGGFSVYWLAGHHEGRFAALIAHAGIFNIEAQYLETEEMFFADYDMGGPYWDKSNVTAQGTFANSPHKFVDKWTAPMLITVGELDYRILASQGMMAFNAAKMNGLEAEMLVFPDENHWVLKPQNAILWQRVFFRFLDKYLKGKKADKPEKPYAVTTADSF